MTSLVKFFLSFITIPALVSCAAGHQDFIDLRNDLIVGRVISYEKAPDIPSNAGEFIRGDYVISGKGLTHIDDKNGQLIYHVFVQEILPNTRTEKEWIGKCLVYYVVASSTKIVLSWGFDDGGNPLSCRTWT